MYDPRLATLYMRFWTTFGNCEFLIYIFHAELKEEIFKNWNHEKVIEDKKQPTKRPLTADNDQNMA